MGMRASSTLDDYHLGPSRGERDRLLMQADVLAPEACWLLDRIAVRPGWRVADVACGPIGILALLAERVGPAGEVVGLDRDSTMLADARENLDRLGLDDVRLVAADATDTGLPPDSFDLAHVRLLLVNVRNPADVVAELATIVRPGGVVAVQEVDWISWQCQPPHPAWERLRNLLWRWWDGRGLDPYLGRQLPALLRDAGLVDVQASAHAGIDVAGHPYQDLLLQFVRRFREELVAGEMIGQHQLDMLVADLERHLADPATVVIRALTVQAWGRRPA